MTESFNTPEWVREAVFYQVFPDRFAFSQSVSKPTRLEPWDAPPTEYGFKGGDLIGIVEHLDYLQDLGVTALYLNPIFQSTANHRYHTYDYYCVDPLLGGNEAFFRLLNHLHHRGMRLVLDGVFNHASRGFFQFNHILENGAASPYLDWFTVTGWPLHAYDTHHKPNYAAWWGLPALPKFNTDSPDVREFIYGVAKYWVEQGIDGWRLDVPEEIEDDGFWREFRVRVKQANADAYITGEVWHDARRWLQGDQFDAVMNYLFAKACIGFFAGSTLNAGLVSGVGYSPIQPLRAEGFSGAVDQMLALYRPEVLRVQLNLIDSHDTARFLSIAQGDESALRLAMLFMMCFPGAPCVYYGDEIGLAGGKDPDCRRTFPWDEERWNAPLRNHVRAAITLRKAYPALRRGGYRRLLADGRVYAFGRKLDDQLMVAVFNAGNEPWRLSVPVEAFLDDSMHLQAVWGECSAIVQQGNLTGDLVPSRSAAVFLATN